VGVGRLVGLRQGHSQRKSARGLGVAAMLASGEVQSPGGGPGAKALRREWNKTLSAEGFQRGSAGWGERNRASACRK
jgi:hypothetical protein